MVLTSNRLYVWHRSTTVFGLGQPPEFRSFDSLNIFPRRDTESLGLGGRLLLAE